MKIAVIGAGAAGLVCARELLRAGHEVTIFEQSATLGGVWVHTPEVESDRLGRAPTRRVFASLYDSLRTNLPRDLMAFRDYSFDSRGGGRDEWPQYPDHTQVLAYLRNFAEHFDIDRWIRFGETVVSLTPADAGGWHIVTSRSGVHNFEGVAVCNGHYSVPRVPRIAHMECFNGALLHSHNYRRPDEFRGRRVAVLGAAASGADLAREIATVAEQVYWFARVAEGHPSLASNVTVCSLPNTFAPNNSIRCADGSLVADLDAVLFCTGYEYTFPFLDPDIVRVTDNWVHPLYLDIMAIEYPSLGFIGLPFMVFPFPLFEMQARWFAQMLSGEVLLPPLTVRQRIFEEHIAGLRQRGVPQHHFHKLAEQQFRYTDYLATQCGAESVPQWFKTLAAEAAENRMQYPGSFRDIPLRSPKPESA